MHWRYKAVSLAVCTAALTGCASFNNWVASSKTFHNREQDYLHQTVSEHGPLKTPEGLEQPNYKPAFDLPEQSHILKPAKGIAMTPPTFTNNNTAALQQTLDALQAQLAQMRKDQAQKQAPAATPTTEPVVTKMPDPGEPPSAQASPPVEGGLFDSPKSQTPLSQTPTNATKTEVVTLNFNADIDTLTPSESAKVVALDLDYNADSDTLTSATRSQNKNVHNTQTITMNLTDDSAVSEPLTIKPMAHMTYRRQPRVSNPFSVSMNQTKDGVPYVSVDGSFGEVWYALQTTVEHMGYRITRQDEQDGYLFIRPLQQSDQPDILLYVQRQGR